MPDHDVALALLERTGPLAVSSANRSGLPAALDAEAAATMLGDDVEVILDGGPTPGPIPSSIVDVTDPDRGRLLRAGVLTLERL